MQKIGITGGIGSGKTTASKVFELLGVPVYYSDEESKQLLYNDETIKEKVVALFGNSVLNILGDIDRKALGTIVFKDKEKLQQLNAILHPAVALHFTEWAKTKSNENYILKEAAILFESGANKQVEKVITVSAPEDLKIKRAMHRDTISKEQVEQRMKNQMSDEEKIKLSQFVIYNDEEQLLIPQIIKIHKALIGFQ